VANEVGMRIGDNRILTWNDYIYWVENCIHSRDDAIKVMKTLYTSFQYVVDYKLHLCICINYTYNLSMIDPEGIGNSYNFLEKMITFRINQFRMQVNATMLVHNGYQLRIIRPRGSAMSTLDKCIPKYLFPWMITEHEPTNEKKENIKKNVKRLIVVIKQRILKNMFKRKKISCSK
jgi:hypothetical protein